MKPSLFIGSSVKALNVAYAVQENLEYVTQPTVWDQGVFHLSKSAADSLLQLLDESDFGIFVFNPDDSINIRGEQKLATRDNVILELGLFLGRLGPERSFMFVPRDQLDDFHLPTDLIGFTPATYDSQRPDQNLRAATGPACNQVREAIEKYGPRSKVSQPTDGPRVTEDKVEPNSAERADSAQIAEVKAEAHEAAAEHVAKSQRRSPSEDMVVAYIDRDVERGDKAYEQAQQDAKDDPEQLLRTEAIYLSLRYGIGDVAAFYKLQNLRERAKEFRAVLPLVHNWIGLAYERGGDPLKASEAFEAAAETAETREIHETNKDEPLSTLYEALADLYQKADRDDLRAIALQKAIEYRPNDTNLQFAAAYASSSADYSALALMRYKTMLRFDTDNYAALNNIGILYGEWDMPILQVSSYKRAIENGNTLAAANLANKYIDAGFSSEARAVLDKAKEEEDFDPNVGSALASLSHRQQSESDLEDDVLKTAGEQRRFLLSFAEAYFEQLPITPRLDGEWRFSTGEEAIATMNGSMLEIKWERNKVEHIIVADTKNRGAVVNKYVRKDQYYSPSLGDRGYARLSKDGQQMKIMVLKDRRHSFLTLERNEAGEPDNRTAD